MSQILPDVVVLSVPALTVQQLPVNHPTRKKNCLSKERNTRIHKLHNLDNDQNRNELQYVKMDLMKISKKQRM